MSQRRLSGAFLTGQYRCTVKVTRQCRQWVLCNDGYLLSTVYETALTKDARDRQGRSFTSPRPAALHLHPLTIHDQFLRLQPIQLHSLCIPSFNDYRNENKTAQAMPLDIYLPAELAVAVPTKIHLYRPLCKQWRSLTPDGSTHLVSSWSVLSLVILIIFITLKDPIMAGAVVGSRIFNIFSVESLTRCDCLDFVSINPAAQTCRLQFQLCFHLLIGILKVNVAKPNIYSKFLLFYVKHVGL